MFQHAFLPYSLQVLLYDIVFTFISLFGLITVCWIHKLSGFTVSFPSTSFAFRPMQKF
jgi:O-antigen ligase